MKRIITWSILLGLICFYHSVLSNDSPAINDNYEIDADITDNEITYHNIYERDVANEEDEEEEYYEDDDFEDNFEEEIDEEEIDDEDDDRLSDDEDERVKRQFVGVPGPRPPPATINRPRRIVFDDSKDVSSDMSQNDTDGGFAFISGSLNDEDSSDWSVVTSTGYEYQAQSSELRSIFAVTARFSASDSDDGISYSGTPTVDGISSPVVRGPPGPAPGPARRSVFGTDTRRKVTNFRFPYSAIGRFDNGCTGFFIGPRHILTAGHCVYSFKTKKWFRNLTFRRRKDCDSDDGVEYRWKWAITVKGWKKYGWATYDYAMVVVTRSSPVRLGYGWKKPIPKWTINIAGYPDDKPGRCMWRSSCKIQRRWSKRLGYRCDTNNGMSGSPVYVYWKNSNKRIAYCIHAHGRTRFNKRNKCVRITKARFNQFKNWISKY